MSACNVVAAAMAKCLAAAAQVANGCVIQKDWYATHDGPMVPPNVESSVGGRDD